MSLPDRKNGINLIPSRYHWDQLDAKVIVLDINFPVRWANVNILGLILSHNKASVLTLYVFLIYGLHNHVRYMPAAEGLSKVCSMSKVWTNVYM
jgi:hypothetical protein